MRCPSHQPKGRLHLCEATDPLSFKTAAARMSRLESREIPTRYIELGEDREKS